MQVSRMNQILALALIATSGECFVSQSILSSAPNRAVVPRTSISFRKNFGRTFASTTSSTTELEVERLRAMAEKLRQDAARLQEEQTKTLAKAAERVFGKFDKDKDGAIDVQELKQGLERFFKVELDDKRASQLLNEFDVNQDGALQLEEFVGVEKFRNKLDAIARQERESDRQEAKKAQEEARMAELLQVQMELVNDAPPTISDKVVSVLPYLFPLLDGLQFGRFFIEGPANEGNALAIAAIAAFAIYRSIPLGGFLSFFGLNFLSENPRINRLVRFNSRQAVFLDIALFAPAILATLGYGLLNQLGVSLPPSVAEVSSDAMFIVLLAAVGYSVVSSLLGETPNKLPFISQRVEDRMISSNMLDAEGRFAPLDDDGNPKKFDDKKDD